MMTRKIVQRRSRCLAILHDIEGARVGGASRERGGSTQRVCGLNIELDDAAGGLGGMVALNWLEVEGWTPRVIDALCHAPPATE